MVICDSEQVQSRKNLGILDNLNAVPYLTSLSDLYNKITCLTEFSMKWIIIFLKLPSRFILNNEGSLFIKWKTDEDCF